MEQQAWPDSRRIFSSTHSGATSSWRLFRQLWDSENLFSPVSPVLPSMAFTSVVTGSDLKHPICHRLASIRSSPLMWSMSESLNHWSSGGTTAQQPEKEGQFWKYHLGTNCQFSDASMKHTRNRFNTSNLKTCFLDRIFIYLLAKSTLYTLPPDRIEQWNEVRSLRSKPHHLGHFWGGPQGLRVIPQWPSGPGALRLAQEPWCRLGPCEANVSPAAREPPSALPPQRLQQRQSCSAGCPPRFGPPQLAPDLTSP